MGPVSFACKDKVCGQCNKLQYSHVSDSVKTIEDICICSVLKIDFYLTFKAPNKNCSRRHLNFLLLSLEENKACLFHM